MNRSGAYVEVLGKGYKSFNPTRLQDINFNVNDELVGKLGEANRLLGKLDGLSLKIPSVDLFVGSYVRKEAVLSSRIEGTQASLVDILDPNIDENANADVLDVVNYVNALNYGVSRLKDFPLCSQLLKEIHVVLLKNVRGGEKYSGEFKKSQNWIGGQGSTLKDARYIPPEPQVAEQAMSDLEKFINNNDAMDPLLKIALAHYQFETIHPFLDGNGRIGRMMIVLYLLERRIISHPVLYISYYLKKNRVEYYDRLDAVRLNGNYEQWVSFFLDAIIKTCENSIEAIKTLDVLFNHDANLIKDFSASVQKVFLYIQSNPIIDITKTADALELSYNTVHKAVNVLSSMNILKEFTTMKRNKAYAYSEYLKVLNLDTE